MGKLLKNQFYKTNICFFKWKNEVYKYFASLKFTFFFFFIIFYSIFRSFSMSNNQGWNNIDFNEITIKDRLGGGGIGIIYSGSYKSKTVALKTLFSSSYSPEEEQEFMDELLVMSRLKHSNIVSFIGACMTPPNRFFVMELCETSLYNILHESNHRLTKLDCVQAAVSSSHSLLLLL